MENLPFEGNGYRASRGWFAGIAMFVVGAVLVSVVDHFTGTMEPTNLRPLHILLGVLLMGGAMSGSTFSVTASLRAFRRDNAYINEHRPLNETLGLCASPFS